jgi:catalase
MRVGGQVDRYALIDVGVKELNRNPENFFADVEQSAFNPANVPPGIGLAGVRAFAARLRLPNHL